MFKGHYLHSIDAKGRVSIPSKLRRYVVPEADNSFIMVQGVDKCIDIYPKDKWLEIEEKLQKLNPFLPKQSRLIRTMLHNAHEDTMDSQSRILVPQNLLEYAGIKNEVLILGALKKIEIWDPQTYNDYMSSSEESFADIAAEVMSL